MTDHILTIRTDDDSESGHQFIKLIFEEGEIGLYTGEYQNQMKFVRMLGLEKGASMAYNLYCGCEVNVEDILYSIDEENYHSLV